MELAELRMQIDAIDGELIRLFERRMEVAAEIAKYKQRNGLPVLDPEREKQKLVDLTGKVKNGHEDYISALFSLLFEISRAEQQAIMKSGGTS